MFETASIKATRPEIDFNLDALLSRIKALEEKISIAEAIKTTSVNLNQPVVEEKKYNAKNSIQTKTKQSLTTLTTNELKGKILTGLRSAGSEMLWNLFQNVEIEIVDKVVNIYPKDETDTAVLQKMENRDKILEVLDEFDVIKVEVLEPRTKKQMDKIEDATEKLKKIFGEDIVIIKNENK